MAMYAALSTCAIAITMVTEGNLVGVNFSRGEKLGVALLHVQSKIRVPLFAARTLNAPGQYRVTLSLW